ncbi:endonuclease domain-containing protein [Demequina capsici]|uniref:DUF559 domain-containing protein n=1 Tax=Demequina capsici TaxID=3075620 RepID=A0AA96F7U4_9MICO|nr:DUF559 domain-containing protein [Demequina sp. OYTSA14]WNM23561.1 DUF559 domain-containing protein [Demequina sp. OYTSA14]
MRTAISSGRVVRLLPDAYVGAEHSDSFLARAHAALLWAGSAAAVSGTSAMFLWGLVESPPSHIEVLLPHPIHLNPPDWLVVRRRVRPPATAHIAGLAVLEPADAIVTGYGRLSPHTRAEPLYRAVRSGLVSPDALADAIRRAPRVAARRELSTRIAAAQAGAESFLEEVGLRSVFNTAEFAGLLPQHRVRCGDQTFRLDLYDPVTRTGIELDGAQFHDGSEARQRDVRRDAALASIGIQTVRFTFADIVQRPAWCRQTLAEVLRARER